MKKLMFVAAVAAAMTGLADVTSANIVGYHNNTIALDGQQFKSTACFVTIGAKDADGDDCVRLSDLKVTGYLDDGLDMGGCWGDVWIDMLHTNGDNLYVDDMVKSYYWYEELNEYEAGWYDESENPLKDDQSVLGNADEITFKVGEGICFNTRNGYDGCQLVSAGQVYTDKVSYLIALDGQQIAANPLARTVYLSELTVTGYLDDGLDMGGCWGDIWIDMLHTNGDNLYVDDMVKSYYWYEELNEYEAGWYDESENPLKDDQSVLGNADEIGFEMGEGICVNARNGYDGCFLEFPKMELAK